MAAPFAPDPEPGEGEGALVSWAERTARWDRRPAGRGMVRFVFYGRVSTEDWQDPVTSRARQREQAEALVVAPVNSSGFMRRSGAVRAGRAA
jgi:hypothetical protein